MLGGIKAFDFNCGGVSQPPWARSSTKVKMMITNKILSGLMLGGIGYLISTVVG